MTELHPDFKTADIDDGLLSAYQAGEKLVAVKDFKYKGQKFQKGDAIMLTGSPNDDKLLRHGFVATKATVDYAHSQHELKHYQADVLGPLYQEKVAASSELSRAEAAVTVLQGQIRNARAVRSAAKKRAKAAEASYQVAQDNAPAQL